MLAVWQAISPSAPVPNSQYPRQSCGWYALWYGRGAAGPSHSSQWTCLGTGGVSVGRATMSGDCFQ